IDDDGHRAATHAIDAVVAVGTARRLSLGAAEERRAAQRRVEAGGEEDEEGRPSHGCRPMVPVAGSGLRTALPASVAGWSTRVLMRIRPGAPPPPPPVEP